MSFDSSNSAPVVNAPPHVFNSTKELYCNTKLGSWVWTACHFDQRFASQRVLPFRLLPVVLLAVALLTRPVVAVLALIVLDLALTLALVLDLNLVSVVAIYLFL